MVGEFPGEKNPPVCWQGSCTWSIRRAWGWGSRMLIPSMLILVYWNLTIFLAAARHPVNSKTTGVTLGYDQIWVVSIFTIITCCRISSTVMPETKIYRR
ncbi:hypothetical protein BDV59DRAFT_175623 [Aspergillus ambiguus]|uniref:uncharacterized protein n=1 Tax=Aspergillus ambiguus TaxID=176160 RepID=UPI003CCCD257